MQGWEQDRQESSHRVWRHPDGRRIMIAAHESQELSRSKLAKILKDAGHTLEEFFNFCCGGEASRFLRANRV
jgi:predicted RNA binding protein YcfA (HicA-like mRNA interferase family)